MTPTLNQHLLREWREMLRAIELAGGRDTAMQSIALSRIAEFEGPVAAEGWVQ